MSQAEEGPVDATTEAMPVDLEQAALEMADVRLAATYAAEWPRGSVVYPDVLGHHPGELAFTRGNHRRA
jgi:hypothetical protein